MRVVVVGAGIAGLAAAERLRDRLPDAEVLVLEGSPRVGGKLALAEVGGVTTDVGAEALLQRRPEAVDLARAAGLAADLVEPQTISASLWSEGALTPLPRTLMGIPPDGPDDGVPVRLDGDVSVGDLVADHVGEHVVQRLVEPMLGGVYAGHAHELSLRATVPGLVKQLDGTRSLTEAAAAAMSGPASGPVFAGIRGGVARLPLALAERLDVRTGAMVRELHRTPTGFELVVGPTREERLVTADAVVLATPARPASRLLADVAPAAAAELAEIEYASMAVVTVAVRELPATSGSGFLVPPAEGRTVKGATYSFAKWGWVGDAGDVRVLRCSVGRHREEQVLQRDDGEIVDLALADLSAALEGPVTPVDAHVQRWGGGLPQYAVGHLDRIARVRAAVEAVPGLAVCGAAYDGVGVPATIASAQAAADQVVAGTMEQ